MERDAIEHLWAMEDKGNHYAKNNNHNIFLKKTEKIPTRPFRPRVLVSYNFGYAFHARLLSPTRL